MNNEFKRTGDGHEAVVQVNCLSTGLLSTLLLPKLAETAKLSVPVEGAFFKPHLCIVASDGNPFVHSVKRVALMTFAIVHYWSEFPQKNLPGSLMEAFDDPFQFANADERYQTSKLLDVFMAREIAKLPITSEVIVTSACPGKKTR